METRWSPNRWSYIGGWGIFGWVLLGIVIIILAIVITVNATKSKTPPNPCQDILATSDCKLCNEKGQVITVNGKRSCDCQNAYTGLKCEDCSKDYHWECVAN